MIHSMPSVAAPCQDFTFVELAAAEAQLPPGWALDRAACACRPVLGERGWGAVLALVGPGNRTVRCSSALHISAVEARAVALASVGDAAQMIQDLGQPPVVLRQTALAVAPPQPPTLRPSQIISLRGAQSDHRP